MRPCWSSLTTAVALWLALPAGAACAQTMYKCVATDGKTSYSDQPCAGKVAAKKEIDVRANRDDMERANRQQAERRVRERLGGPAPADEPAQKSEQETKLAEGSELDRRLHAYQQLKIDAQKRIKADEEARAEASRLWQCRRGKEPEKCQ